METMIPLMIAILTYAGFLGSGIVGQEIQFDDVIKYNQTCGLSPLTTWSAQGSVVLTPGDLVGFRPKVSILASRELCTVDLTSCPPAHLPTSPKACYCTSQIGHRYKIHVGSESSVAHSGMTLQAVVPGYGPLANIFGATTIGTLPQTTENTTRINATFTVDDGTARDLLDSQTISVCPTTLFQLEICVPHTHAGADLKVKVGAYTSVASGVRCVRLSHRFTSGQDDTITFEYNGGCTQSNTILLTEDSDACPHQPDTTTTSLASTTATSTSTESPTTTTATSTSTESPTTTTATSTSTESPTTTTAPQLIDGVCPNTPRKVTTLASGHKALVDDVSFNTSWIVFQRRVSGAVDFYRPWSDYEAGFGNVSDSYWLGLKQIHQLCNRESRCELVIHLKYEAEPHEVTKRHDGCYFARYSQFWLGGASTDYTITVSGYTGTAGDSLNYYYKGAKTYHADQQPFSTYDRDNDQASGYNCAKGYHGAGWFNACFAANVNGGWGLGDGKGIKWGKLTHRDSATFSEMELRRLA